MRSRGGRRRNVSICISEAGFGVERDYEENARTGGAGQAV